METKMIRIIDGRYNEQFRVEDGGHITVDGKPYQVRYLDETHFQVAGRCFHICEFGERVIDKGQTVLRMENSASTAEQQRECHEQ